MRFALTLATLLALPLPALANCGGSFSSFLAGVSAEAQSKGYDAPTVSRFRSSARQDPKVLRADRAQGVFQRPFIDFSRRLISTQRLQKGQQLARKYNRVFDRVEQCVGVGGIGIDVAAVGQERM